MNNYIMWCWAVTVFSWRVRWLHWCRRWGDVGTVRRDLIVYSYWLISHVLKFENDITAAQSATCEKEQLRYTAHGLNSVVEVGLQSCRET